MVNCGCSGSNEPCVCGEYNQDGGMKKVYVVGRDGSVESLFHEMGWSVHAGDLPNHEVDLVIFTGGSDIDPIWYGEENTNSYTSMYSRKRDSVEFKVYEWARHLDLPKAGICRGGQLFNIANGGKMIQHIDGHGGNTHDVFEYETDKSLGKTNSCHHQMMVPTDKAELIAYSYYDQDQICPEIICYKKSRDLCFQAHPEWGHRNTTNLFFRYINHYFDL